MASAPPRLWPVNQTDCSWSRSSASPSRTVGKIDSRASPKPWWMYPVPAGPGTGGVTASVSQSRICTGSVPRKPMTIILSLAIVYAWVSSSGNGGVNRFS